MQTLDIQAGNFYFKPDTLTAKAGIAKIKLTDDGGIHTLVFDGAYPGFMLEVERRRATRSRGRSTSKPGKYTFYCNITGHRAPGDGRHHHRQVTDRSPRRVDAGQPIDASSAPGDRARACAGSGPSVLAARPQVDRGSGSSASTTTSRAAPGVHLRVVDVGAREHLGNVRRNSARLTGPTTHTSSAPSCTLAPGVITMPLA